MGMFFGENEDDIARRKAENDDKSMFFSESDDDIARRKVLNSDKSLFFSESDDDIARRKVLNSDKSLFFSKNCNNEKGEEMGIFYDNSKKISYEEMYGQINETNERIERNKTNEIEVHKEILTETKKMKEIKEKKYYCIIYSGFYNSGNGKFKTVILECIDRGTADDINRFISGNYFKTYGIAKEVLNSDVWKNRFWDYRKNKEKKDELLEDEMYYSVDDDGVDFNSCFDFLNSKIGNCFTTKEEALDFFENDYPKSIKRIKDFTNELMKKNGYEICGYDLIKK